MFLQFYPPHQRCLCRKKSNKFSPPAVHCVRGSSLCLFDHFPSRTTNSTVSCSATHGNFIESSPRGVEKLDRKNHQKKAKEWRKICKRLSFIIPFRWNRRIKSMTNFLANRNICVPYKSLSLCFFFQVTAGGSFQAKLKPVAKKNYPMIFFAMLVCPEIDWETNWRIDKKMRRLLNEILHTISIDSSLGGFPGGFTKLESSLEYPNHLSV